MKWVLIIGGGLLILYLFTRKGGLAGGPFFQGPQQPDYGGHNVPTSSGSDQGI